MYSHLISIVFKQSEVDVCEFFKVEVGHTTVVIVYVDDCLTNHRNRKSVESLIESLEKKFISINTIHGPLIEYLGMNLDFRIPNQVSITMENKV